MDVYKFWHFQYFLCCRCKFQCNYVYLLLCQGLSQCFQIIIFLYLYKYSLILLKMRKLVQFCKYTLYISSITLSYHECSRIRFSDSFLVVRGEIIYSSVLFRNLQSLSFLCEQKLFFWWNEYQTTCIPIDVNYESVVIFKNETTKRSTTKNFFSKY